MRPHLANSRRLFATTFLAIGALLFSVSLAHELVVTLPNGQQAVINWGIGELKATGQAVAPTNATTAGQKQLLARRGAVLDAQRNLLETLSGVYVAADSTMVNFMASDVVRTQVQGIVQGATITFEGWDAASEIYTVEMAIPLDSVRKLLDGTKVATTNTPTPQTPTGIVINTRGLNIVPSLTFRIVTVSGVEVAGAAVGFYIAAATGSESAALEMATQDARVTDDPFVVTAVNLLANRVDIVVTDADGELLALFLTQRDFFGEGRTLVIVN